MRRNVWIPIGIIILLVLLFGNTVVTLFTDWLWFSDLGHAYEAIFAKIIWTRLALAAVFALLFFAIVYTNLRIARHLAPPPGRMRVGWEEEVRVRVEAFIRRGLGLLILLGSIVIAFFVGLQSAGHWDDWLKFANASSFGRPDPVFGLDIGFYVFKLPFWDFLYGWLFATILVAAIATAALHYVSEGMDFFANTPRFAPGVKAQLAILLAALFFLKAAGYRLMMYHLVLSPGDLFYGAGYTDMHARMPALWILMVAAVIGGIIVLVNMYRRGIWLAAGAFVGLIGLSIVVGALYPASVESVRVKPNELEAQRPYIARAIDYTRHAFDVDRIAPRSFDYVPDLTPDELAANPAAVQNIRLWDYDPLKRAYNQLQVFQQYYDFNDVDIDRYMVNGTYRQVMLSARELAGPPQNADTWVNRYVRYTHGYGYVMSPVNAVTPEGRPVYFSSGIPVQTVPGLDLKVPQIYFGELTDNYVLVHSKRPEFDYPTGATEVNATYNADSGPIIGSFFRRLMFALRFGDANIMLSNDLEPTSRILFRRNIATRVKSMFPFLSFDKDPYLVTVKGRMYWFHDAYTTTANYPYSQALPDSDITYIRNSVKLVTDAYTGKVTAYIYDRSDPIIRTYSRIFPGVFRPMSEMPGEFKSHVRYPEDLFNIQATVYSRYHMTDPSVFYSGADLWQIPTLGGSTDTTEAQNMEPYYIITRLPNSPLDEFILILPLVRPGKNNMVAWMAAKCDPEDYGKVITYEFPRGETVFGPRQVMGRADQDTTISSQVTLWNQSGSQVVRGNMLAIPINNSILYVEPLYLQSTSTPIPEFKRVIVSLGDRLVMAETLQGALSALMGGASVSVPASSSGVQPAPPSAKPTAGRPIVAAPGNVQQLIKQANDQFNRAQEAQRKGDWAGYGREIDALKKTLGQLQK
jgi:uncharacterized protein